MRAVSYELPKAVSETDALIDVELPRPEPLGRDLLVEVKAVSVNPVDVKIRARVRPAGDEVKILGWDAAGVVAAAGPDATLFKPGDAVFYAGAFDRPGTNAQFHLVDERIVGPKPGSLDFAEAAALPLTAITAWEALFDRLDVRRAVPGAARAIVIIGGAGGVGSIAIQLARTLTDLTVIATASRPQSKDWAQSLGAHHVIDHHRPLGAQIEALGVGQPAFVFSTTHSESYVDDIAQFIAPQGRFALIDDPKQLNVLALKRKSVSLHWEFMFTRSLLNTADIEVQHALLREVAALVDAGRIQTTLTKTLSPITADTVRQAHEHVESGRAIGKIVVANWP
jgi:zinc-binding alcohol dehydrogenase family protein